MASRASGIAADQGSIREETASRLHLRGASALLWLEERGWAATPSPAGTAATVRLFADEIRTPSFSVRRLWHTPLTLVSTTAAGADSTTGLASAGFTRVMLQVEGDLAVQSPVGQTVDVSPTGAIVAPLDAPLALTAASPTARIEVVIDDHRHDWAIHGYGFDAWSGQQPSTSWSAVANLVNTILASPLSPDQRAFPFIRGSVEHAVAALLTERRAHKQTDTQPGSGNGAETIVTRADDVIRRRAADPQFTVEELARTLNLSRRYLTKVLTGDGATPRARLRRERVRIARELMGGRGPVAPEHPEEVARLAGFSSVRSMREALRSGDG